MKDKKNKKLVPELRFSEFEGEWRKTILGNSLLEKPEYGINAPAVPYSEELPTYLRITDISEDGYFIKDKKVSVAKKVTEENYLNEGDIVLARTGASVGKSYKYNSGDGRLVFAGFLIRIKANDEKLSSDLLFQFLSTDQYWRWVKFSSVRSGQPGINGKQYASMPITLPPTLPEQLKIAHTLTSLDELIAAEQEKRDALSAHKKGLLQQLFPGKDEKLPKLRFKEFSGEWEETTLGEVGKPLMCKRIFKEQTTSDPNNAIPFYKIGTFGKNADAYIPIDLYKEYKSRFSYPNVGDILISASGTIGRLVVYDGADAYYQDSNIVWLGHNERDVFNSFLYYCYSTLNWQTSDGGVIKRLYNSNLKEMVIFFPKKKEEQQKIAHCLSSLDELIAAQSEKINALRVHKKGLMQGLFPVV